jgi:hypothetical protein
MLQYYDRFFHSPSNAVYGHLKPQPLVYLLVSFSVTVSHLEGVCRQPKGCVDKMTDKGNRLPHLRASPNMRKSSAPGVRCAQIPGYGSPLQTSSELGHKKKERKRLSAASCPLLPRLSNDPLVHPGRVCFLHVQPSFHRPSYPRQLQEPN